MINKLEIHNYKSLNDLTLEVGRFNVLIGENGCGKSNLLEAIALASAAAFGALDNEFLVSRGIRVTEPKLMRSAFDDDNLSKSIKVNLNLNSTSMPQFYEFFHDNQPYSKWITIGMQAYEIARTWNAISKHTRIKPEEINLVKNMFLESASKFFDGDEIKAKSYLMCPDNFVDNDNLKNFLIYSPENTALRNFSKEGQIEPLGINGEGLLKLLKVIKNNSPEQWQEIQDSLELFDWFDGIEIPTNLSLISNLPLYEDQVNITDRYLTQVIDQRSANEGFLFVLFYIALMVSKYTPKIFAIDNIDTSLNPKLCTKLIKVLINLAKKYDKQVFVTTHNPAILDGINLGDDEQRLLVVSRNKLGHTNFKRIKLADKPRSSNNEELKLSEAFLRGYLGGLPKGF